VSEQYSLIGDKLYDNISGNLVHTFVSPDPQRDEDVDLSFPSEVAITDDYAVINDYVFSLSSFSLTQRLQHEQNPNYNDEHPYSDYYHHLSVTAAEGNRVLAVHSLYDISSGAFVREINGYARESNASADGRLTSADQAAGFEFTVTHARLSNSSLFELVGEEPERGFVGDAGHTLSIDPSGTPLRGILEDPTVQVIYAVLNPGSVDLDDLPRGVQ